MGVVREPLGVVNKRRLERAGAQSDRPGGHTAGDGERRRFSGKPGGKFHHRHEPRRRRRIDERRAAVASTPFIRAIRVQCVHDLL